MTATSWRWVSDVTANCGDQIERRETGLYGHQEGAVVGYNPNIETRVVPGHWEGDLIKGTLWAKNTSS